jgi:hypothetical protein
MAYTDWIPVLEIIQDKKETSILEFGIGAGTKALVDNFGQVFSLEILNDREWFDKTVDQLKDYKNYRAKYIDAPELFAAHDEFTKSAKPNHRGNNFQAERPAKLLLEILEESKNSVGYSDFDGFFVDAGVYLRGEIVNFVLQYKPRFVLVHDTNGFDDYGYNLVTSGEYAYFGFNTGDGTGLFLRKEKLITNE